MHVFVKAEVYQHRTGDVARLQTPATEQQTDTQTDTAMPRHHTATDT